MYCRISTSTSGWLKNLNKCSLNPPSGAWRISWLHWSHTVSIGFAGSFNHAQAGARNCQIRKIGSLFFQTTNPGNHQKKVPYQLKKVRANNIFSVAGLKKANRRKRKWRVSRSCINLSLMDSRRYWWSRLDRHCPHSFIDLSSVSSASFDWMTKHTSLLQWQWRILIDGASHC